MFSLIGWIILGAVAGGIAKLLMPGKDPGGCIVTILLGIAGAVVGGWILGLLLPWRGGEPTGFVGAILGAVLLLWLYRIWARKR